MNRQLNIWAAIAISIVIAFVYLVGVSSPSSAQGVGPTDPVPEQSGYEQQPLIVPRSNIQPIPTPITLVAPITEASGTIISDQSFLTGYPWEASEVQMFLEEQDSVLAVAQMDPYGDGITMPASEAIASIAGYLTVSPPVLLTLGEMEHGLLSRKLTEQGPLSQEETDILSGWFYEQAKELSAQFYTFDNLRNPGQGGLPTTEPNANEGALLASGLNSASLAVQQRFGSVSATDASLDATRTQVHSFTDTYSRYFGEPVEGNITAPNGDPEPDGTQSTSSTALPRLYFPWTGRDTWVITGGPHGTNWSALDFQPTGWGGLNCVPKYVSDRWITAAAGGRVIANSGFQVIIDHDYDGNINTGWQTKYFHVYNIRVALNQNVNKNTQLGNPSCYGGIATGVHGHFETQYQGKAQGFSGKSVGGWRVENGSYAYGGALRKGNLVRQPNVSGKNLLVSNNCSINLFYAEYFNETTVNNSIYPPGKHECTSVLSYSWGTQSPGYPIEADNYYVRWEGEFTGFNGSEYTFVARADDGIRVYLDYSLLIDKWYAQSPTPHYVRRTPTAGSHHVKVEYFELGGGATARVGWCPANYYIVDYYNNKTLSGRPAAWGCQSAINFNWGSNAPVSSVNADNFSARWMGLFSFGTDVNHFFATGDDGVRVYVDNSLIINAWKDQGATEYRSARSLSSGLHSVMMEYYESGGGAVAALWWSPNQARNRYSIATSTQSSTSYPAKFGNDGSNSTRWSSSVPSTLLRNQWWIVDLGSRKTFSQVRINWENAYAKEYWVAWKDDGASCDSGTYSGYKYGGSRSGWVTHGVGTRTAKCLAVIMTARGPYTNYSFWETEVFRPIYSARTKEPMVLTEENFMYTDANGSDGAATQLVDNPVEFLPVYGASQSILGEPVQLELTREDFEPTPTN